MEPLVLYTAFNKSNLLNVSLKEQREKCLLRIKDTNKYIIREFCEGTTDIGNILDRPIFKQLLQYLYDTRSNNTIFNTKGKIISSKDFNSYDVLIYDINILVDNRFIHKLVNGSKKRNILPITFHTGIAECNNKDLMGTLGISIFSSVEIAAKGFLKDKYILTISKDGISDNGLANPTTTQIAELLTNDNNCISLMNTGNLTNVYKFKCPEGTTLQNYKDKIVEDIKALNVLYC